jgi:hypothetical protein
MSDLFFIGDQEISTIERLWQEGLPRADIADAVGIRTRQLETLKAKGLISVPKRQGAGGGQKGRPPSPSEIKARCREVQARWTKEEEQERRAGSGTVVSDNQLRIGGERLGRWHYETTRLHPLQGRTND